MVPLLQQPNTAPVKSQKATSAERLETQLAAEGTRSSKMNS